MHEPSFSIVGSATRTFPISLGGRVIADPAEGLFFLAEPRPGGDKVKAAIERAAKLVRARCAHFHYWRAFDIWYRKARSVEAYEIDAIVEAAEAKEAKAIRDEIRDVRTRLLRLESILVTQDAEFHRETVDFVREQTRRLGGKDRP